MGAGLGLKTPRAPSCPEARGMLMVCGVYSVSEQVPGEPCDSSRLGLYVRRWLRWVRAGLGEGQVARRNGWWTEQG